MAPLPLTTSARIEIDGQTLAKLLANGKLHVCELRCLDADSKQLLHKLCLNSCALNLAKCSNR